MSGQTIILHGPTQRAFAHKLIDEAGQGFVVNIKEPKRTTEQNNRMWAMLTDVSRAMPKGRLATPVRWKFIFMDALGYACAFETGLDGKPFAIGLSTSNLSVREMSDLMELIAAFGAENGVVFSEPEQDERAA